MPDVHCPISLVMLCKPTLSIRNYNFIHTDRKYERYKVLYVNGNHNFIFYIQLLIETFLQIMNDQLYLNLFFIYNIHIFCISVFFLYNIVYYIFRSYFYFLYCMHYDIFYCTCLSTKKNNIRCTYM